MTKITPAALAMLAALSACTTDGHVDWGQVGEGVLLVGGATLIVAAAMVGAQPPPPLITSCTSWRHSTTCITQ